jgi:uncharacterized protein
MAEHPNATLVRRAMDAMNRGDMDALDAFMADDIVWHYIGGAAPIRGKEAMAQSMGTWDWTITAEIHDVMANDVHAVALVKAHAERGGKRLDYDTAEIFHIASGKFSERWAFSDDTARIVEFFA